MSHFFASGSQSIGSFSFSISLSNEYSGLISFRMDWLDLLAVQGTLKSLHQQYNSEESILQCSAFFMVQLLHPYMAIGQNIALTIQGFVSRVLSLLFNMLSRFVIAFLPGASVFQFHGSVVTVCSNFGTQENRICHCFQFCPFYLTGSDGTGCHDLSF